LKEKKKSKRLKNILKTKKPPRMTRKKKEDWKKKDGKLKTKGT